VYFVGVCESAKKERWENTSNNHSLHPASHPINQFLMSAFAGQSVGWSGNWSEGKTKSFFRTQEIRLDKMHHASERGTNTVGYLR
jgi:hypothetical protein